MKCLRRLHALFLILITAACGGGDPRPDALIPGGAAVATGGGTQAEANQNFSDSVVARFARQQGWILLRILATHDSVALIGVRSADSTGAAVVAVRRSGGGIARIGTAIPLEFYEPFPSAMWFELGPRSPLGLSTTYFAPVEGVMWTGVYVVQGGELKRTFGDAGGTCKPAELRDVNGDGIVEVVSYTESSMDFACDDECLETLRRVADVEPAWVEILQWSGASWEPSRSIPADFWRSLAQKYAGAVAVIDSGSAPECSARGEDVKTSLREWSRRAGALASVAP